MSGKPWLALHPEAGIRNASTGIVTPPLPIFKGESLLVILKLKPEACDFSIPNGWAEAQHFLCNYNKMTEFLVPYECRVYRLS